MRKKNARGASACGVGKPATAPCSAGQPICEFAGGIRVRISGAHPGHPPDGLILLHEFHANRLEHCVLCLTKICNRSSRRSLPAGITTVLTLSTISLDSRKDLPKVRHATALDWFLLMSFLYCIATLLQFAAVHYFTKVPARGMKKSRGNTVSI